MLQVLSYMELNNRGRECSVGRWSGKIWLRSCPTKLLVKQMALKQKELQSLTGKLQHACKAVSSDHTFLQHKVSLSHPPLPPPPQLFFFSTDILQCDGCLCVHMHVCVFFLLCGSPWTPQAPTVAMQLLTQELGNNRPVIWCKKSTLQVNNNLRTSRFEVV